MSLEKYIIPSALVVLSGADGSAVNHDARDIKAGDQKHCSKDKPTKEEIRKKIHLIIIDKLGVKVEELNDKKWYTKDLNADSLDTVELIMEFEKAFGIFISDDIAESIATIGDTVDIIYDILYNGISFFSEKNFAGKTLMMAGDYYPYSDMTDPVEGGVSSLRVPRGYRVTFFDKPSYKGQFMSVTALETEVKISDLSAVQPSSNIKLSTNNNDWDNKIVSVKVERFLK